MDAIKVTLKAKGYEGVKGRLTSVVETPTGVIYRVEVFRESIDLAPRVIGFAAGAVGLPRGFVPVVESPAVTLVYRGRSGNTVRFADGAGCLVRLSWDGETYMRHAVGRAYRVSCDKFGVITSIKAA